MVPIWALIVLLVWLGVHLDVDSRVIAGGIFVLGLVSNAFVWMLGIIAMVPVVGPVVAKVLTVGFFWLLNALGYFVSFVAIRRGYSKDVLTYRSLTIALLVGVVIGYVLGKLL
ncbi:MAG: hypothetical protein H6R21_1311 [Proteobacteria bacterium]|nr:hypothetical protein [Pseudomonadota bacterium]